MSKKELNKITGNLGEDIAVKFLLDKGLKIVDRNYLRSTGEIDIVAHLPAQAGETKAKDMSNVSRETLGTVHFIEVKTVSYETRALLEWAVTHETYRPEELVHQKKLEKIQKTAYIWLVEHNWHGNLNVDVVAVRIVPREKYARVRYIPNVIVG